MHYVAIVNSDTDECLGIKLFHLFHIYMAAYAISAPCTGSHFTYYAFGGLVSLSEDATFFFYGLSLIDGYRYGEVLRFAGGGSGQ